jgi:hypothetical protein
MDDECARISGHNLADLAKTMAKSHVSLLAIPGTFASAQRLEVSVKERVLPQFLSIRYQDSRRNLGVLKLLLSYHLQSLTLHLRNAVKIQHCWLVSLFDALLVEKSKPGAVNIKQILVITDPFDLNHMDAADIMEAMKILLRDIWKVEGPIMAGQESMYKWERI